MRALRALLALIVVFFAAAALIALASGLGGTDLGTLWHGSAPESLNLTQAVVQRYIHPVVWTHVMVPVLLTPASIVFATVSIAALLLWLLARRNRSSRR